MKVATLFAGCGGLDLGFKQAGFNIVWSNEYDKTVYPTHHANFPEAELDTRSIVDVEDDAIPDVDGIIGGPPCQSWSEAGAKRGIEDARGKLFHEYIRLLKAKKPKFFLAENVSGILHKRHETAFQNIIEMFEEAGYVISYKLLNACDFDVPQDRKRVIIVGFHESLNKKFVFPEAPKVVHTLRDSISDLVDNAVPAISTQKTNPEVKFPNHEYMTGGFSSMFMSRNRVRTWDEPSFTIQAGGRHAPIHPQAPRMVNVGKDKFEFAKGYEDKYRRMSVRECARVQTFPDDFIFDYTSVADGYKMVGNAVPVTFAKYLATAIKQQIV
ncbi:DNA cytosine methyltransferase [Acinetobacter sp. WCHAc060025]|uniref:DNA cytosine methyltransferase n=1 Tax=Acinetobacter sp. WCHAc060025 TaxID=2518625 RepID=UPI0010233273|nr:DNA cytosine methyltransferase [Acinetobacter sp. WCHAc060025]RZG77460.1 DNA cytosine methyltransferase [Acinetobacter sp. WCHAc060025]